MSHGTSVATPITQPATHGRKRMDRRSNRNVQPANPAAMSRQAGWTCPASIDANPHANEPRFDRRCHQQASTTIAKSGTTDGGQILRWNTTASGLTATRAMPQSQIARSPRGTTRKANSVASPRASTFRAALAKPRSVGASAPARWPRAR